MDYLNGTFNFNSFVNTILPTLFIIWVGYYSDCNRDNIFRRIYNYQQEIEIERFKIENLLRSITESLVVIENEFRIELVNDNFRGVFEVSDTYEIQDLLKGFNYWESRKMYPYNQESLTFYEDVIHFMNLGPSNSVLFGTVKYKDKYFEWRGSKSRWNSSNSIILISREVTSFIHLEISRSESKYKTAMLRSVSHELRTPTGAIASLSENMLEIPNLPDKVRSDIEMVIVCAKLLLNLINDLLDYSQILTGTFNVCKRNFEFRPFLQECSSLLKVQCNIRKLDVITSIHPNIPEVIYSDPDRLRQIILNLLSNSIK
jgi:signal transduction histidine kinase